MSTRLHAVTLVVPDYDAGLAFYAGVMEFTVTADIDLGGGKRWVLVAPPGGGAQLLLARAADSGQAESIGRQAGGRVAFFLQTDDFEAEYSRMKARGVTFEETPRRESYGMVVVWRDPFGNRWDLLERADAAGG
ncbi:MAG: VOC family protein [Pseudomonadota bacterium]